MKFDVITGNPMIAKQENGKYQVAYHQPSIGKIENHTDLTREEVAKLPFVNQAVLGFIK